MASVPSMRLLTIVILLSGLLRRILTYQHGLSILPNHSVLTESPLTLQGVGDCGPEAIEHFLSVWC